VPRLFLVQGVDVPCDRGGYHLTCTADKLAIGALPYRATCIAVPLKVHTHEKKLTWSALPIADARFEPT
jgi:hypothetical protein